jgi:hypothetical protein
MSPWLPHLKKRQNLQLSKKKRSKRKTRNSLLDWIRLIPGNYLRAGE